ncbi:MAG: hypothetical protein K2U26_20030 [Cyclobacteriaceae bacterium]|nr:hypothetical protein [Cyclobacteriaceae bacterium]
MSCPACQRGIQHLHYRSIKIKDEPLQESGELLQLVGADLVSVGDKDYKQCATCQRVWLTSFSSWHKGGNRDFGFDEVTTEYISRVISDAEFLSVQAQMKQAAQRQDPLNFHPNNPSPDGKKEIIFENIEKDTGIAVAEVYLKQDGAIFKLVSSGGGPCVWSADSRYAAFTLHVKPDKNASLGAHPQKLVLVDTHDREFLFSKRTFENIHIRSWTGVRLSGTNQEKFRTQPFDIDMERLTYEEVQAY